MLYYYYIDTIIMFTFLAGDCGSVESMEQHNFIYFYITRTAQYIVENTCLMTIYVQE